MPFAADLNYAGQRLIMHRFKSVDRPVVDRLARARWFIDAFARHYGRPLGQAGFFEIGSGWHLGIPLSLYTLGVERQTTVDIRRLARVELINKAIAALNRVDGELPRRPGAPIRRLEELEERFGIVYRAPFDARKMDLAAGSLDCVHATLTFQHIPAAVLRSILLECHRILGRCGLLLAMIDYGDNYAYTDRSITIYNFLRYSERQWRWFNPPLHFQNRMRHTQYLDLLASCGYHVLQQEVNGGTVKDLDALSRLALAPEFSRYSMEDLAVRSSRIAAGKIR